MSNLSASAPVVERLGPLWTPDLGHWLILGTVFIVVAGNAIIPIWSGLIPTMLFMPLALMLRNGGAMGAVIVDRAVLPWLMAMLCLAVLGFLSVIANSGGSLNWTTWVSTYVSPIVLYVAVRQYCDDLQFVRKVIVVALLASMFPLGFGLLQYYREWGIPSGVELLLSRYFIERMGTYMAATFGSTGSTASYLALVVPLSLAMSLVRSNPAWIRWLSAAVVLVALANTLIVQSRSLFWILLMGVPAILWFFRVRVFGIVITLAVAVGVFVLPFLSALDELLAHTTSIFGGSEGDNSVSERVEAMHYGLRTLTDFPALGVGPGNTLVVNPYTSAHQFWLQQGSELGIGGLVASFVLSVALLLRALLIGFRRSQDEGYDLAFACYCAVGVYVTYGVLGNMSLANTFVNAWIGLLAVLIALGEACLSLSSGNISGRESQGDSLSNGV